MILKPFILLSVAYFLLTNAANYMKVIQSPSDNNACIIVEEYDAKNYRGFEKNNDRIMYSVQPVDRNTRDGNTNQQQQNAEEDNVIKMYARSKKEMSAFTRTMCKSYRKVQPLSDAQLTKVNPEIRKIIDGGDQQNRIDVVFMGDGYTAEERTKFFDDMERLTEEMFEGATFRSYLPVFNIWAIYVESKESGIGYDSSPKNTPFQLYRNRRELRGIYTRNANFARSVCALTGSSGCDYPSLIANDDFYGGLGGEFVISTRSYRTGTIVLRHECGHNFVNVGEEYDGGSVYRGVNAATSVTSLGWSAWLSGKKREERAIYRLLEYPWEDFSRGPQTFTFTSDGSYSRWYLDVSVSAAGEEDSLEFLLDGVILEWKSSGYDDREFYGWHGPGLSSGRHNLTVRSKTSPTHPVIDRMLCSVSFHEYGSEDEFVMSPGHISAYPTWDLFNRKTFRPTNEGCLMRNMTHDRFCSVCQEGMWMEFLLQISLIDEVRVSNSTSNDGTREVVVETLKLGQLREPGNEVEGETLEIKWFRNNIEQPQLQDQLIISAQPGSWTVRVHLNTPEVRHDPRNLLTSSKIFVVSKF